MSYCNHEEREEKENGINNENKCDGEITYARAM